MIVTSTSPLSFTLHLTDGRTIRTFGEAVAFVGSLSAEERSRTHWELSHRMLQRCLESPDFLHAATISLRSALLMDGLS